MSIETVEGLHYPPSYPGLGGFSGGSGITTQTLDAAGEKFACLFRVQKTGVLRTVHARFHTVAQAPAGGIKVSVQGVDSSVAPARPDGVITHFRSSASGITAGAWFNPGTMTADGTGTGAKRTLTRGEWITLVWEFNAFATGDALTITLIFLAGPRSWFIGQAYPLLFTGSWNVAAGAQVVAQFALEYDDGTFAYQGEPVLGMVLPGFVAFGTNTVPHEVGIKITPRAPLRVGGIYATLVMVSNCDMVLYDDASTVLATSSLNVTRKSSASTAPYVGDFSGDVTSNPVLQPGRVYRATVKGVVAGFNSCALFDVHAAAAMAQFPLGADCIATERTGTGAWTDTPTRRYNVGLVLSGIGGGGGRRGRLRSA